jgi:hypothetical protein
LIEYLRDAIQHHADCKHHKQWLVRRRLLKLVKSLLAIEINGEWYVIEILAGQTLSMYPNAMSNQHMQIHAEINTDGHLVVKADELHWTMVFDEVLTRKFF